MILQDLLDAANGIALAIKQMLNSAQQVDIVRAIKAPPSGAFDRTNLDEFDFPKAQHVLWQTELIGHFADRAECVR